MPDLSKSFSRDTTESIQPSRSVEIMAALSAVEMRINASGSDSCELSQANRCNSPSTGIYLGFS